MGQQRPREEKPSTSGATKGSEKLIAQEAVPAVVEAILGRTGTRGELSQVKCRILKGKNAGKQLRRNVRGPVTKRDVLMLRETEIEARRIQKRINKGNQS